MVTCLLKDFDLEEEQLLNPCQKISITNALRFIGNPVRQERLLSFQS